MDLESVSNYEEVKSSILEKVLIIFIFKQICYFFHSCMSKYLFIYNMIYLIYQVQKVAGFFGD